MIKFFMFFKKWWRQLQVSGRNTNFLLISFIIFFSGFGYFFINKFDNINYFDQKINFDQKIIKTFYYNNNNMFLLEEGMRIEASKHNISATTSGIKNFIESMSEFQVNGKFDKEKYNKFLEQHQLKHYQIMKYALTKKTNEIFKNMFPSLNYSNLTQNRNKSIQTVSGTNFIIKDEIINESTEEKMKNITKAELLQFAYAQNVSLDFAFIEKETRTGFLVILKKCNKQAFPDTKFKNLVRNLNKFNKEEIVNYVKNCTNNITIDIVEYNNVSKNGEDSDFLFQEIDLYQDENNIIIPVVQHITPISFKEYEDLTVVKKEYKTALSKKISIILATKLANDLNNNVITRKDLEKLCTFKAFVYDINNATEDQIKFFSLEENKAQQFINSYSQSGVFVCNKRVYKNNNNMISNILNNDATQILETQNRFITWMMNFSNQ